MNVRDLAARLPASSGVGPAQGPRPSSDPTSPPGGPGAAQRAASFAEALEQATRPGVTLSAHAQQRMAQRGISFDPLQQQSMSEALQALADKGSRDALLLRGDAAFVVNVPNRTVVTALDPAEAQQRIFTQIDSAMLI